MMDFGRLGKIVAVFGVGLGLAACATVSTDWDLSREASAVRIQRDVETLASDAYEGREAGTAGYQLAAAYVESAFKNMGLEPGGTDGYRQSVPLRRALADQKGAVIAIATSDGGEAKLKVLEDYVMHAGNVAESASVTGQVVFMGYGIDAPSMGYTAFDEHNVRGKIVVVLAGTPDGLASEERAHFGSMLTKVDTAVRHGAIGVIGIPSNRGNAAAGRTALVRSVSRPREIVAYKNGEKDSIDVVARLTEAGMDKVLTAAKVEASSVFEGEPVTGPWDVTLKMTSKTTYRDYTSPNIIGKIVGADPKLRDEYIVLTAHLDHIGKLSSVERGVDIINNGAMDNAMGTASLIEEARLFMAGETPPQRSLLFIALTAEEKGLLGSEYFVENPTVPVDDMVANVNLDLPLALFEFVDVVAFGAQHSSLKDTAAKAAGKLGVEVIPDPVPEMALFVRSDHYNFVKKGIPSIFLIFGFGNGGEEAFSSYMAADYHRPSDQPDLPIRYDMTAKFAELNYLIAGAIANDAERPRWNEDSVFRDLFAPDQPARPSPTGM